MAAIPACRRWSGCANRAGCVAIIWPNNIDWLAARGYQHVSFGGPMAVEFPSHQAAVELSGDLLSPRRR